MDHPEGAGLQRADRVDFDPRVRLEFRGAQISSDGGLLVMREMDDALGLSDLVSAACATAGAAKGKKRLSSGRIQAIFTSVGTPLGECRMKGLRFYILSLALGAMNPATLSADELDDMFSQELVDPVFEMAYPLALKGDARAQMYLGAIYWDERFSENDPDRAMMWLQIAYANGRQDAVWFLDQLMPYYLPSQVEAIAQVAARCIDSGYTECDP
jgi:TPR repeat protein